MDLRPLTLGELLDRAFTLYRRNLWLFVGIMAVPSVLALALSLLVDSMNRMTQGQGGLERAVSDPSQAVTVVTTMMAGMVIVLLAYFVVYAVALGATTLAVSEIYQGRTTTIGEVYGHMRRRLGRLVWLMLNMSLRMGAVFTAGILLVTLVSAVVAFLTNPLLMGLVMVPGMLAVAAICVFMMLRWGVAIPALVLEERGALDAIRRSIVLTRGRLGRVLLLGVCATIITYAALAIFQGPFVVGAHLAGPETISGFWLTLAGTVAGTVGAALTAPIMIVGLALLYYDARVREEGLDLQMMMAALDGQSSSAGFARG